MNGKALEYLLSRPLLCTVEMAAIVEDVLNREGDVDLALARREAAKLDGSAKSYVRDGVAVIPIRGPISRYGMLMEDISPVTSDDAINADLDTAESEPGIHRVVIRFDTPGGEVNGSANTAERISRLNAIKPVTAYVDGMACSKGYWYAAACGEVVCSPTSQLGSVGVIYSGRRRSEKQKKSEWVMVADDSPMKISDPDTEEGRAEMMKTVNAMCGVFISHVATLRGLTVEKVKSDFGRGGVLIGQAAVDAGMADSVGDFESTLARLARGESLPKRNSQSKPKPGKTAATDSSKGTLKMAGLYETLFGRVAKSHPDAAAAALQAADDTDDDDSTPLARRRYQGSRIDPDRPADHAKIKADARAEIEAELKAKVASDVAVNKTLATFFDKQAMALAVGSVKAGRLVPPDVPAFKALFTELALADHAGPLAIEGGAVDRVSVLAKLLDGKPAVAWTKEHVVNPEKLGEGRRFLPSDDLEDTEKAADDRNVKIMEARLGLTG